MSDVSAPSRLIAVARTRHVPRLLGSSLLGRLPGGMAALAVVLLVTAFLVGSSAGSAVAGVLVDRADPAPAFLVGAAYSAVAALLVVRRLSATGAVGRDQII